MFRVGIVGAGLQCQRRAPVITKSKECKLIAITSLHEDHTRQVAAQYECEAEKNWESLVSRKDIDVVIVCTPPHIHADISIAAMKAGKHVLCEKPLSRTLKESEEMLKVSRSTGKILKCGFNHRYHPAITDAKAIINKGLIGKLLLGRCRYGICGRPGYETEWRANPEMASGGQFIEQGTHAIDLYRWLFGEIVEVSCMTGVQYFQNQTLDDNGMAIFRTNSGALLSLHASLTQWKNLFSFEIIGENGYLLIEGLGASYGNEKLTFGVKDYNAPFNDHVTEYRGGDVSWQAEWNDFLNAITKNTIPMGDAVDGLMSMKIALACYEADKSGRVIKVS